MDKRAITHVENTTIDCHFVETRPKKAHHDGVEGVFHPFSWGAMCLFLGVSWGAISIHDLATSMCHFRGFISIGEGWKGGRSCHAWQQLSLAGDVFLGYRKMKMRS